MVVTVKLFAAARDLVGQEITVLELPDGATVADARRGLSRQHPAVAALLARSAIALDYAFALDADAIRAGAELAVVPPVSGG